MSLLVLKLETDSAAASPEMLYQRSLLLLQARRAFENVDLRLLAEADLPSLAPPPLTPGQPVLLLGARDLMVGAVSLRAMRQALDGGAQIIVPSDLNRRLRTVDEPHYTLRAYERREARLLTEATPSSDRDEPLCQLPISLWRSDALAARIAAGGWPSLLSRPQPMRPDEAQAVGFYHPWIDYYGQCREDILPWVPAGVTTVLEVGCGSGATGAFLEARLGCRVTGVELNPEAAAEAERRLHRVIQGDVAALELDERFDLLVATELFEHLAEPDRFLDKARRWVRPGGRILLSVPNVGHWSIVEDLLAGRWDYLPIGLLCYTHYRFFTAATLADWFGRLGFERCQLVPQEGELPERFTTLAGQFEVSEDSLRATGFYVLLDL